MNIQVCLSLAYKKEKSFTMVLHHLSYLHNARDTRSLATACMGFGSTPASRREYPFYAESIELDYNEGTPNHYFQRGSTTLLYPLEKLSCKGLIVRGLRVSSYMNYRDPGGKPHDHGLAIRETIMIENPLSLCFGLMYSGRTEHLSLDLASVQTRSRSNDMSINIDSSTHCSTCRPVTRSNRCNCKLHTSTRTYSIKLKSFFEHPIHSKNCTTRTWTHMLYLRYQDSARLLLLLARRRSSSTGYHYHFSLTLHPTRLGMLYATRPTRGFSLLFQATGYAGCTKSDVVSEIPDPFEDNPEQQWNLKTHGITRLEILVAAGLTFARCEFLSLLKLIGEPVTSLTVRFSDHTTLSESDLGKLWQYCSNLTELSLRYVDLPSLDVFFDAYEVGTCRAASLELTLCRVDDVDSAVSFAATLGDSSCVISRTLHHLRLRLNNYSHGSDERGTEQDEEDEGGEIPFVDMAAAFQSALQTNGYLSYLELDLDRSVRKMFEDGFKAVDGQYLKHRSTPLLCEPSVHS